MDDIILVTADSIRQDYVDEFQFLGSYDCGTAIAGAHYTRPSLASLLCSQYEAALTAEIASPTLPEVLSRAGATCLGFSPTPNTDDRFGFDLGFDTYKTFVEPGNQGSILREYFSKFDTLRRLYYKFHSPIAKSENRPTDRNVIDTAVKQFNRATSPRFLWVHLMESHRPYGRSEGISAELDRKAYFHPEDLSENEQETIDRAYREAIRRVDSNVRYLLDNLETDESRFVFTADHGEAFGETGFYFHRGHERSVADCITKVPIVTNDLSVETPVSLLDVPATICESVDLPVPNRWDGKSRRTAPASSAITIAPWGRKTTVAWQDFEKRIVARDTNVTIEWPGSVIKAERAQVDSELEQQLRDLGYRDAG